MLHYKLPMLFQTPDLTGDAIQAKTILAAPQLLGWDGWRRAARTYLETAGPAVALHPVIEEYSMLTRDFHQWFFARFTELHSQSFTELDNLIEEFYSIVNYDA